VGAWSRPTQNTTLPDTIRLDTARATITPQSRAWRVLSPANNAQRAYWKPTSGSRVYLVWERESAPDVAVSGGGVTTQRAYVTISATIDDTSLSGTARGSLYESLTPPPTASVNGHRIDCPTQS
jgi:hypothetical protein